MDLRIPLHAVLLATGLAVFAALPVPATQPAHRDAPAPWTLPLRSQDAFEAYLRDHAGRHTPLDTLPPGARERFLMSLTWGSGGLGGADVSLLADELAQPQIRAILELFGDELAQHAPPSRLPADAQPTVADTSVSDLERRYNDFYHTLREQGTLEEAILLARLEQRFDAFTDAYAPEALQDVDRRHLAMLWNAASVSARLSDNPRYIDAMEAVLAEILRRDGGSPPVHRLRELRNALLFARRFDAAEDLATLHPDSDLATLPTFVDTFTTDDAPSHSAWVLSMDGTRLTRNAVDLAGTMIVVTSSYGCGFSRSAAEEIAANPVLGPVFTEHAIWLMQPPGRENIEAGLEWPRRYPQLQTLLAYDLDDWPMSSEWVTPVFYIIRDGRIVDQMSGWPRGEEAHREKLFDMLQRHALVGLAAPSH